MERQLIWGAFVVLLYLLIIGLKALGIIDQYTTNNLVLAGIYVILGVSLNLINGFTGQFSIGHAGFMSIGAYFGAIATVKFGLPFALALLMGGLVAALAGMLIGLPTLRLRGDYLAIATLGFGEIIRVVFLNWEYVGGARGFSVPRLTNFTWVYVIAVLTVVIIRNWVQSAHGRACIAVREDEVAASAMGINTTLYKVIAFSVGAAFAGIAGALYAHYFFLIAPHSFGFLRSVEVLIIVVLGGLGSISGSVIAAILLTGLSMLLANWPYPRLIIYSLTLIGIMIYRPGGLMGMREIALPISFIKKKGEERQLGAS
ncbi:MAG TPA: branched-chain amino acid ABC transporter permease [Firmicutes bacterium]|nr:branched-chain amino acid ABC transporter permease [Bacillota bacterium]